MVDKWLGNWRNWNNHIDKYWLGIVTSHHNHSRIFRNIFRLFSNCRPSISNGHVVVVPQTRLFCVFCSDFQTAVSKTHPSTIARLTWASHSIPTVPVTTRVSTWGCGIKPCTKTPQDGEPYCPVRSTGSEYYIIQSFTVINSRSRWLTVIKIRNRWLNYLFRIFFLFITVNYLFRVFITVNNGNSL